MSHRLYDDLAAWWPVLSPLEDAEEDAVIYGALLGQAADAPIRSLLELGCGGGAIAHHFPPSWHCTLVDRSEAMLSVSRARNPDRVHRCADLRTLRLAEPVDAVLLHDAVMYLTDEASRRAAWETVAANLRPGGAALIVPDLTRESYDDSTVVGGGAREDGAEARLMEWRWDPDPGDDTFRAELILAIQEGGEVRTVHETHEMALLSRAQWWAGIRSAGLVPVEPSLPPGFEVGEAFLASKPEVGG